MDRVFIKIISFFKLIVQKANDVDKSEFARTRFPHDADKLTLLDIKIDVMQDVKTLICYIKYRTIWNCKTISHIIQKEYSFSFLDFICCRQHQS